MDYRRPLRDQTTTARAFLAGACCGLTCGALGALFLVWQAGLLSGGRGAADEHLASPRPGVAAASDLNLEGPREAARRREARGPVTGTAGEDAPVAVPHSPVPGADVSPAGELAGRDLLVPVEGIPADRLVQSFSERRGSREHQAIDIIAPHGTPVLAVEDGSIARLFHSQAGGITVYQFDPAEQFCYYYAHLDRYADGLAEGQAVRKGQVIGYVGVSGNAPEDTPHLHFAIFRLTDSRRWWEGTPIDPFDVLSRDR